MDALLIFGIPYYCSAEPGDVWGDNAFAGERERERESDRERE